MMRGIPLALLAFGLAMPAWAADPLAALYGNTVLCVGAGGDGCHLWVSPGGRFTLFGQGRFAQAGHYDTVTDAAGQVTVCLHIDSAGVVLPEGWAMPDATVSLRDGDCIAPHALGDRWSVADQSLMLVAGQR